MTRGATNARCAACAAASAIAPASRGERRGEAGVAARARACTYCWWASLLAAFLAFRIWRRILRSAAALKRPSRSWPGWKLGGDGTNRGLGCGGEAAFTFVGGSSLASPAPSTLLPSSPSSAASSSASSTHQDCDGIDDSPWPGCALR